MKFRTSYLTKNTITLLVCSILLVKLKEKCREDLEVVGLMFLQVELIHGKHARLFFRLDVPHHRLPPRAGQHRLHPTTATSHVFLPLIQQVRCPQRQRLPKSPPRVLLRLHLQIELEMFNVTEARALDMCSVTVQTSVFWLLKKMVSIHLLVISMKIHMPCLQLTMQVVRENQKSILVLRVWSVMRASLCNAY